MLCVIFNNNFYATQFNRSTQCICGVGEVERGELNHEWYTITKKKKKKETKIIQYVYCNVVECFPFHCLGCNNLSNCIFFSIYFSFQCKYSNICIIIIESKDGMNRMLSIKIHNWKKNIFKCSVENHSFIVCLNSSQPDNKKI